MQKGDYLEAWAWTHFMLHDSDDTRSVLLDFLNDLRRDSQPTPLSARLRDTLPNIEARFIAHASTLSQAAVTAGSVTLSD